MTVPRIAVVGRQNVGKSTLVNRLFGKRETIAHDDPGVTRDRVELEATWNGKRFGLIDTAGYLHRATASTRSPACSRSGRSTKPSSSSWWSTSRRDHGGGRAARPPSPPGGVPVLAVVNKVDAAEDEAEVPAFLALGLGDPIAVSSKHGRGW